MKREFLSAPVRWLIFLVATVGFCVIFYGAEQSRRHMANRVIDWLPSGFEETRDFNWFLKHFYEGELLMASWDGCTPDDERLDEIARRLTTSDDPSQPAFYWKVMTTAAVFRELTGEPLNLTPEEAYERMYGWILSKDGSQGCLIAFFSEEGYNHPHEAIDCFKKVTAEVSGQKEGGVRIAGSSLDSVAIDEASSRSQEQLLPLFLLICIAMLFVLLRRWLAVFIIFAAAIFNEELTSALLYYTGTNMDSVSLLSASLLFVLTISAGLHLLNYYRDNMERHGKEGAVLGAVKKAMLPCGLACLTTVLGLYSLSVSQVVPIRRFGQFSTLALIIGTVALFFLIGAFIEQFPIWAWAFGGGRSGGDSASRETSAKKSRRFLPSFEKLWYHFPKLVIRYRLFFTYFNFLLLAIFLFHLRDLETTVTFHGMFPEDAPVIQDYDYLESRIGGLVPVEVIVSVPKGENPEAKPLDTLGLLDEIEQTLWTVEGVDSSLSALTFVPYLPDSEGGGMRAVSARTIFNRMVNERLGALREGCLFDDRVLPEDEALGMAPAERWRISLRVCAKSQIAYGPFLEKISQTVNQTITEHQERFGITGATSLLTGGVPLVHKTQRQLLNDLSSSYLSAFGLILLTLIFLLRGIMPGILAMIPNIFPSVIVFGAMAALRRPIDMGTMMTASVALGISVDGTIHFLTWYRQGLAEGKSQEEAVCFAYRECGTAMVQATLICGGGMSVFALSRFVPISQFAWVMFFLLFIALYGDLVLFPALLAGSLGRFFRFSSKRRRRKKPEEPRIAAVTESLPDVDGRIDPAHRTTETPFRSATANRSGERPYQKID